MAHVWCAARNGSILFDCPSFSLAVRRSITKKKYSQTMFHRGVEDFTCWYIKASQFHRSVFFTISSRCTMERYEPAALEVYAHIPITAGRAWRVIYWSTAHSNW